jgi:hypothetical protein
MPRQLSTRGAAAVTAENSSEVMLHLLEINHDMLAEPIYVVNNFEDIVSNGNTYIAFPFDIALPDESDAPPQVQLQIDNVDRSIIQVLRGLATPATVTLKLVLASTPDTIEAGPFTLLLRNIEFDNQTITGTLMPEDILNAPYPYQIFSPTTHPGLF